MSRLLFAFGISSCTSSGMMIIIVFCGCFVGVSCFSFRDGFLRSSILCFSSLGVGFDSSSVLVTMRGFLISTILYFLFFTIDLLLIIYNLNISIYMDYVKHILQV